MKCPACGNHFLNVAVVFSGNVSCRISGDCDFELLDAVTLNSYWDDDSDCECMRCGWSGTLRELKGDSQAADSVTDSDSASESPRDCSRSRRLAEIKRLLRDGYCNPVWREHIEYLVAELEHLEKQAGESRKSSQRDEKQKPAEPPDTDHPSVSDGDTIIADGDTLFG